jgi:hypothetical protein
MQGYIKGSLGDFVMVHYNGYLEASMQGSNKGSFGPFITKAFLKGILSSLICPPYHIIIRAI